MQCVTSLTVLSVLACIVLQGTAQTQGEPDFKQRPAPPLTFVSNATNLLGVGTEVPKKRDTEIMNYYHKQLPKYIFKY